MFQFTRPQGARREGPSPEGGPKGFNSRARKGRDRGADDHANHANLFQCSRPQGARRGRTITSVNTEEVSIHAPARGATVRHRRRRIPEGVSIHAPARGATASRIERIASILFQFTRPQGARLRRRGRDGRDDGFNSRARKGRDTAGRGRENRRGVSIHAPARGATRRWPTRTSSSSRFNSRARKGRDLTL